MKQPKITNLVFDSKGTKQIRSEIEKTKKIKITINIDQDSLSVLRNLSEKTGAPYQRLLNQILKKGLKEEAAEETRIDRLEKELDRLKRKIAA